MGASNVATAGAVVFLRKNSGRAERRVAPASDATRGARYVIFVTLPPSPNATEAGCTKIGWGECSRNSSATQCAANESSSGLVRLLNENWESFSKAPHSCCIDGTAKSHRHRIYVSA